MTTIPKDKSNIYTLSVHETTYSTDELVINPDVFPKAKVGDLFEIYHPEKPHKKVLLRVPSLSPVKGTNFAHILLFISQCIKLSRKPTAEHQQIHIWDV